MKQKKKTQLDKPHILDTLVAHNQKILTPTTEEKYRVKQVMLIMIQALKEHDILNSKHLKQISALEVF